MPKSVTSGRAHIRGLAPGQHSSKVISQRWRAVGEVGCYCLEVFSVRCVGLQIIKKIWQHSEKLVSWLHDLKILLPLKNIVIR